MVGLALIKMDVDVDVEDLLVRVQFLERREF